MKKYYNYVLLFLLTALSVQCRAQGNDIGEGEKIIFEYDNSGNRISRYTIIMESPQDFDSIPVKKDTSINKAFEDTTKSDYNFAMQNNRNYAETISNMRINIYPNPTQGQLLLEISNKKPEADIEVRVFNISGSRVYFNSFKTAYETIDISTQPSGTYELQLLIDGKKSNWKIIKK